ncbi:bifunctional NAD(P)H-hydrate repair enzyme Nnr [Collibacillus ludicampi]|uniref:Bifunctional NAD(P)H-hydrate repair enzyme n=1 Tax=Collibacillus ludicampi TaxID=2771369 RepID=A0AAV4LEJ4_9BACL|nr:NAD(P)H-hydrate dehydratase [Collibacillus ludicampi]GIM46240.1 bifunctional NAD(P)H-hydrate repair enzyme Nnr [Collibacillus ludicampi]
MFIVTSQEMKSIDAFTIESLGLPARVLMENAGYAVARVIESRYPKGTRVLILAGKGNNGGDGLVAARHLADAGYPVHVILAVAAASLSGEAAFQYERIQRFGISSSMYDPFTFHRELSRSELIVDALLGTGTKGSPRHPYDEMIVAANESRKPIVAVDIPSGLDADNGHVSQPCIRATCTVSLAFLKRGLVSQPGAEYAGECVVERIGIPHWAAERHGVKTRLLTEMEIAGLMRPRHPSGHKGTYGHVMLVGSCRRMVGAGLLAAHAAVRTGAGLVTLGVPASALPAAAGRVLEVMLTPLPDNGTGEYYADMAEEILLAAEDKDVLAVGPGLGRFAGGETFLRKIIREWPKPLILDADALYLLAQDVTMLRERTDPTILTPHPGEMARLLGCSIADVQMARIDHARTFATTYQVTLVLKGNYTVIAHKTGDVAINPTGNPGMATGGTGDVLTGMIASLVAQGYDPYEASCLAVYLHGATGDRLAEKIGQQALAAGDLIEEIGPTWIEIERKRLF